MKHATAGALDQLDALLTDLRTIGRLREKTRGVFYFRGRAFLHFHEDVSGLFADVRFGDRFDRWPVNTAIERKRLIERLHASLPP